MDSPWQSTVYDLSTGLAGSLVGWGEEKSRQKVYNCHHSIVYMSVTMKKPAEQGVVTEKVKSIADINRQEVVMTSAPVAEVDGYDTVY